MTSMWSDFFDSDPDETSRICEALEEKKYEAANTALQKSQKIINEFRMTLKMEYEISKQLLPLYDYCYDRIFIGNLKSDLAPLKEAQTIMTELRDAGAQAMKKARMERGEQ